MDRIAITIGILGAVVGYMVGVRVSRGPNDQTPMVSAAGVGVVFYLVAYELAAAIAVIGVCGALFFFFRDVWPSLSRSLVEFSRSSGLSIRRVLPEEWRDADPDDTRLDEIEEIIREIETDAQLLPQEKAALLAEYRKQRDALR